MKFPVETKNKKSNKTEKFDKDIQKNKKKLSDRLRLMESHTETSV